MNKLLDGIVASVTSYFVINEYNAEFWQAVVIGIGAAVIKWAIEGIAQWIRRKK